MVAMTALMVLFLSVVSKDLVCIERSLTCSSAERTWFRDVPHPTRDNMATVMIAIAITLKFLEVVLWKTQALVIVSGHRQRQG